MLFHIVFTSFFCNISFLFGALFLLFFLRYLRSAAGAARPPFDRF